MLPDQYLIESGRTCTDAYHTNMVPAVVIESCLQDFIRAGKNLDSIKKALFYGKPLNNEVAMLIDSLPANMRDGQLDADPGVVHAVLGIATEAVEIVEHVETGEAADFENESGDLLWYMALLFRTKAITFAQAMAKNIKKLKVRFPDKFDAALAINKNEAIELNA